MDTRSLTGLRFIAALIVLNFHYGKNTEFTSLAKNFLTAGPMMVTFFFVLSGFVLTRAYLGRERFSSGDFFAARIARILPLYMLALVLSLIIKLTPSEMIRSDWIGILLSTSLLQGWFPPFALVFNGPAWAISAQMFFYLLFPMTILYLRQIKPKVSSAWIFSIGVYLITQLVLINLLRTDFYQPTPSFSHSLIYYFPLAHFCSFLLGVVGGYSLEYTQRYQERGNKLVWTVSGGLILYFIFYALNTRLFSKVGGYRMPVASSFLGPVFLLLILIFINQKNLLRHIFQIKPMLILGEASYALYIFQSPVYRIYIARLAPFLGLEGSTIFYLYALVMVILALLLHFVFERPARRLILKLWDRWKADPLTAGENR